MMRALYSAIIAFAFPGMLEIASAGSKADYVFTNGRIYTISISQPWAEAVAVKGNKIAYVGNNKDAKDKLIDLNVVDVGAVGVCQHGYSYHKH